uniref:Uncharacterized protein n=1 Tax=Candidatus Methanophaga sp. ANME-1 ERB7 TaxID=2759913 RepID=A0A7G9ZCQ2_9EURY|nr:hypothetical protein MAPFNFNJ_00015 [Methanosarcinales archaeon ANME-1 ERB7]
MVLFSLPEAPGSMCATSVSVFNSPATKGPMLVQVIRPAETFATGVDETKLMPAGRVSTTVTGLSAQLPVLLTVMMNLTRVEGAPSVTSPTFVTAMSGCNTRGCQSPPPFIFPEASYGSKVSPKPSPFKSAPA